MKRLQLRYWDGDSSAEVIGVTYDTGLRETDVVSLGTVTRNAQQLWSARSAIGVNHGDLWLSKWAAAEQLALGLGKAEYLNIRRDA